MSKNISKLYIMFTTVQSYNLGKSTCINTKPYYSSMNTMDVSFKPVKTPNGNANYIAILENDDENIMVPDNEYDNKSESESDTSYNINHSDNLDIYTLGNDSIKSFYIGSITVVGLFILYRILDKTT